MRSYNCIKYFLNKKQYCPNCSIKKNKIDLNKYIEISLSTTISIILQYNEDNNTFFPITNYNLNIPNISSFKSLEQLCIHINKFYKTINVNFNSYCDKDNNYDIYLNNNCFSSNLYMTYNNKWKYNNYQINYNNINFIDYPTGQQLNFNNQKIQLKSNALSYVNFLKLKNNINKILMLS